MRAAKKINLDRKILQELVPLNALSPERFKEVSEKILVEEVKSGRYLFRKGARDNQSIYLLEGKVNLIDGFRKVASEVKSGTDISRYPISNMQPRTVSARAAKKSIIARIDSSLLDAFLTWDQSNSAEAVEIGADENSDWMTRMLQSEAFIKIPPSMIQSLLMKLEPMVVKAGDTIIRQGDEGEYFYTIREGRCAVTCRGAADADEQLLAEIAEGESFGEESLVNDSKRNATVSMLTDGVLMRLAKEDFVALLQEPLIDRVDYKTATEMVDEGAVWVDVRTPDEYESGAFEDSVNIPLATLRGEIPELVFNAKYVMCCDTGRRSGSAAFMLSHRGFDVYVLDGGISGLEAGVLDPSGLPDRVPETEDEDASGTAGQVAEVIDFDAGLHEAVAIPSTGEVADTAATPTKTESAADAGDAEVEALRTQNEKLRADLDQYHSTEARLTEQLEMLRGELGESGEKLASLYTRAKADTDEKQQLHEENARFKKKYARQLKALQSELEAARQQLTGQQAGQSEILQLQEELAQSRSRAQTLEDELTAVSAAGQSRQDEHAAVVQEQLETIAGLQDALEQAGREHEQLRNQLSASNEELEVSENGLRAELQERIALSDSLGDELAALRQKFNDSAENLAAATARSEGLETQNAELLARLESLQQELDDGRQQMEQQVAAAEAEQQVLERRIEEINSANREDREYLSADHEAAALKIQSLEQDLEKLGAAQRAADVQLQEQGARADNMAAARQAAEEALEQRQAEWDAERARLNEETGALRQSIEALRSEKSAQLQQHEERLLELQQDQSAQASELHEIQEERDSWQQKFNAQVEENNQLQQHVAGLNDQVATLTAAADEQLQSLQSGLDAGQQRNSELEQAVVDKDAQLVALQEELDGREADFRDREQQQEQLRQELLERDERASLVEQENQEAIRQAHEDLTRKNDNEKELQRQIDRLRKKLEQATLEQQQVREGSQTDIDNIREELHAERQARAEERAEMAARQRELKEQLVAVASEHETNLNNQSGAIEQARDAAREEERVRLRDLLQTQQQTEDQLQKLQQELQQAHAEIASQHQQEKQRRQAGNDLLQEQSNQAESAIAQLETQLKQLTQERDESLGKQQALQEKLNVLRGEMEVARGLMNAAGREGQGEAAREQSIQERDALRDSPESHQGVELPLHVPSLDEGETGAIHVGPLLADEPRVNSDSIDVIADLTDGEAAAALPGVGAKRKHSWFGSLIGVVMVGISALMFWLILGVENSPQRSGGDMEEPATQGAASGAATASPDPVGETLQADAVQPVAPVAVEQSARTAQPAPVVVDNTQVSKPAVKEPVKPATRATADNVIQQPAVQEPAAAPVPALTAGPVFRDKLKNGGKGPFMVELPGGSYMMGSAGNSLNFDEGPRHQVTLKGFSVSRHEVSFTEYDRFARATGRRLPRDERWGRGDRPVINVSWHDASAYTAWLSKQTGKTYRLPTESEWEYAIRAGGTDQHWWASGADPVPANCFNCGSQWDGYRTAPVGSFAANNFGLYDMAGNVQEWVQDCYRAGYADAPVDGSARLMPQCTQRAVRGGAYSSPQDSLRSARRGQYDQDTRLDNIGFRIVRDN
jgi:formylglycine-generating enzyme required for sulfatase activity/rhodanese-related sulfurtransferase/CRP-like cAMP-binding protein/chromosome segregation ATPase